MKPKYIVQAGAGAVVVPLDSNVQMSQVNIRAGSGVTVTAALENPDDFVSTNNVDPPAAAAAIAAGLAAPSYQAVPAAVNGVINLVGPYRALLLTATGAAVSTILQQGIQ